METGNQVQMGKSKQAKFQKGNVVARNQQQINRDLAKTECAATFCIVGDWKTGPLKELVGKLRANAGWMEDETIWNDKVVSWQTDRENCAKICNKLMLWQ